MDISNLGSRPGRLLRSGKVSVLNALESGICIKSRFLVEVRISSPGLEWLYY